MGRLTIRIPLQLQGRPLLVALACLLCAFCIVLAFPQERVLAQSESFEVTLISDPNYGSNGGAHYVVYLDGQTYVAYCNDPYSDKGPIGTFSIDQGKRGTHRQDYLFAHGYPNTTVIAGVDWGDIVAEEITQIAVWMDADPNISYEEVCYMNTRYGGVDVPAEWYEAARVLFNEADAYHGGDASIDGTAATYESDLHTEGAQRVLAVSLLPKYGSIALAKHTLAPGISSDNACYSLKGAVYGIYRDQACTDLCFEQTTGQTNPAGSLAEQADDFWQTATDIPPGTYWVKETSAPNGFAVDSTVYRVTVNAGKMTWVSTEGIQTCVYDKPLTATLPVWVHKTDNATPDGKAAGNATLGKALITVNYYDGIYELANLPTQPTRTWVLETDENGMAAPDDAHFVSGDELYRNDAGDAVLPLGTVTYQETKAPDGYAQNNSLFAAHIIASDDGASAQIVPFNGECDESGAIIIEDAIVRGDLSFSKVSGSTMRHLTNVPFLVTSRTTGEQHILVTDENGEANTALNRHSENTNVNDAVAVLNAEGSWSIDESKINPLAGIWFSGRNDTTVAPNDDRGALPFDIYDIAELPCSANEGLVLANFTVSVSHDGYRIDMGTIEDVVSPSLSTTLCDSASNKLASALEPTTLTDSVQCFNLMPYTDYTVDGELHALDAGGQDCGVVATATKTFAPQGTIETIDLDFTVDASPFAGGKLVAFEYLRDGAGNIVASHADIDDENQTVTVPSISTTATDRTTHDHVTHANETTTLIDTVAFTGLDTTRPYTITGTLHRAIVDENGITKDAGALVDEKGEEVTATTTFTPTASNGTVDVAFTFDSSALEGETVVAYEQLTQDDTLYAAHADIANEAQSVKVVASPKNSLAAAITKTGDALRPYAMPLALASGVAMAVVLVLLLSRNRPGCA